MCIQNTTVAAAMLGFVFAVSVGPTLANPAFTKVCKGFMSDAIALQKLSASNGCATPPGLPKFSTPSAAFGFCASHKLAAAQALLAQVQHDLILCERPAASHSPGPVPGTTTAAPEISRTATGW